MLKFCIFTDQTSRATVFVNPHHVRFVRKDEFSQGARIAFDQSHGVTVAETPQAVIRALEEATLASGEPGGGDRTTALLDLRARAAEEA